MINWANQQAAPILTLDAPSGLDAKMGKVYEPAIQAVATMTSALPKARLLTGQTEPHVGELYLADISVPPALYASSSLQHTVGPIFATNDIVVRIY